MAQVCRFLAKPSRHDPSTRQSHGHRGDLARFGAFSAYVYCENIAFETMVGLVPRLIKPRTYKYKAKHLLERLGVNLDISAPLKTLAIAQRQIVAIARALMEEARIIFMDEPTASLTQSETDILLTLVRTLADQGVSVVFVSHRLAEVIEISKRVTVIRDGRLVGVFPTEGMTQSRLMN